MTAPALSRLANEQPGFRDIPACPGWCCRTDHHKGVHYSAVQHAEPFGVMLLGTGSDVQVTIARTDRSDSGPRFYPLNQAGLAASILSYAGLPELAAAITRLIDATGDES